MDCLIPSAAIPDIVDCRQFLIIALNDVEKHIATFEKSSEYRCDATTPFIVR
jgi:hypothetical protein